MSAPIPTSWYRYRAARPDGRLVRGALQAVSAEAAVVQLEREGLYPLEVQHDAREPGIRRRASRQDLAIAFRNVAALTRAGVPVERALAASEALVGTTLREAITGVRRRIREGEEVAQALRAHPDAFPPVVVGMVAAGERGSTLPQALEAVAEQLEEEANLRSQIRSALTYPALVLAVGLASVFVMGTVVIPRFAEVLGELGAELPASTRLLLAASEALRRLGLPLLLVVAGALVAAGPALQRAPVRRRIDALLLRVPLVGAIRHGFASARVCRALGATLSTGMPLLAALDAAAASAGDLEVSARLARAREAVVRGERLTPSLAAERALTPLALQLVGVGESTGELGPLTSRAGGVAAERAQRSLRALISLVEPALVIGLGLLVALTAGALLQAVYSVRPGT